MALVWSQQVDAGLGKERIIGTFSQEMKTVNNTRASFFADYDLPVNCKSREEYDQKLRSRVNSSAAAAVQNTSAAADTAVTYNSVMELMSGFARMTTEDRAKAQEKMLGKVIGVVNVRADGYRDPQKTVIQDPHYASALSGADLLFDPKSQTGAWKFAQDQAAMQSAFGYPRSDALPPSSAAFKHTHFMLDDAYLGRNTTLEQIQIHLMLQAKIYELDKLLPVRSVEGTGKAIVKKWVFNDHETTRTSYESVSRLVTSHRTEKSASMLFFGVSQRSNRRFLRTPMGQVHWAMQKIQMRNAMLTTSRQQVMTAVTSEAPAPQWDGRDNDDADTVLSEAECESRVTMELAQINIMKRQSGALDQIGMCARTTIVNRAQTEQSGFDLTMIAPQELADFELSKPEHEPHRTRIPREGMVDSLLQPYVPTAIGQFRASPQYNSGLAGKEPIDLCKNMYSIGETYPFWGKHCSLYSDATAAKYATTFAEPRVVHYDNCQYKAMATAEVMRASCAWVTEPGRDLDSKSILTPEIGPLFFNYTLTPPTRDAVRGGAVDFPDTYKTISKRMQSRGPFRYDLTPDELKEIADLMRPARWNGTRSRTRTGFCHTVYSRYSKGVERIANPLAVIGRLLFALDLGRAETQFKTMLADCSVAANVRSEETALQWAENQVNTLRAAQNVKDGAGLPQWLTSWSAMAQDLTLYVYAWTKFCIENDIPHMYDCVVDSLYIHSQYGDVWVGKVGQTLGNFLIGNGEYHTSQDLTGAVRAQMDYHSATLIAEPKQMVLFRGQQHLRYEKGSSYAFFNYEDRKLFAPRGATSHMDERYTGAAGAKSLFVRMLPFEDDLRKALSPHMDVRGHFANRPLRSLEENKEIALKIASSPLYSNLWYRNAARGPRALSPTGQIYRSGDSVSNTVTSLGHSLLRNEHGDELLYTKNCSPFGPHITDGQAMLKYVKTPTCEMIQTPPVYLRDAKYKPFV